MKKANKSRRSIDSSFNYCEAKTFARRPTSLLPSVKARPASSEKLLGSVVPRGITGSLLASSMHDRSPYDQFRSST
jgi:hypothetical protein